jgi:CheY-like chemotaxis protein
MNAATVRNQEVQRILIVEGDADTRALYRESLEPLKADLIDAADARSALVSALVQPPSLVITDTRLPGFDGYHLCDVLRRDGATRTVPILMVTSEWTASELQRAHDAGADRVLIKPLARKTLLQEVARLLRLPRDRRPPHKSTTNDSGRRITKRAAHLREMTPHPPISPRDLLCPSCDWELTYQHSYLGGVSIKHPEQWDRYTCRRNCGTFEYRVRTRRLRRVS